MSWREATALLFIIVIVLLAGYDLLAYSRGGNAATISNVCLEASNEYRWLVILITFAVGTLFGHLFLAQHVN